MTAPPILTYDVLPSGSRMTVRRDQGSLVIDVPCEGFATRLRRSLRSPGFWAWAGIFFLTQNLVLIPTFGAGWRAPATLPWFMFWFGCFWAMGFSILMVFVESRQRDSIQIDRLKLVHGGTFWRRRREFEIAHITSVRATSTSVVVTLQPLPNHWLGSKREIYLIPGRAPAELQYVAREMSNFLRLDAEKNA